jgi:hypothetical protein
VLEGAVGVLVVMSDELPPDLYQGRWQEEEAGYALGLILGPEGPGAEGFELSLSQAPAEPIEEAWPQALAFLRALAGGQAGARWQQGTRRWAWERR